MGDLVFGCDICQDVCPWNEKFAATPRDVALLPKPDRVRPDIAALLRLDDDGFRAVFRGSAITRTKRRGLARNAAAALGNRGAACDDDELTALRDAAEGDRDPMVREQAARALARIDAARAVARPAD
jgi:epoxyqueuosine reductase